MEQKILRLDDVKRVTGLSKTAVYGQIKRGAFPRPIQLAPRAVGWRADDIDNWIASRPEAGPTQRPRAA